MHSNLTIITSLFRKILVVEGMALATGIKHNKKIGLRGKGEGQYFTKNRGNALKRLFSGYLPKEPTTKVDFNFFVFPGVLI